MKDITKACVGCLLILPIHVPRLLYRLLLFSYAYVFNRHDNLTADPKVHLKQARKLLRGQNSQLLYAALEVRFALERMVTWELVFAEKASNRDLDEHDPVKKLKALRRIDGATEYMHQIYFVNKQTGERFEWGKYKPLDQQRVKYIKGRLGDLLHPKLGLSLGINDNPWYIETREFLAESIEYLSDVLKDNTEFFFFDGMEQFEMVKTSSEENASASN